MSRNLPDNPIARAAFEGALRRAVAPPAPRAKYHSRTADKFVIRGNVDLFQALGDIGKHHGRSVNSEVVAAVMEAIDGHTRANALISILKANLGAEISEQVLAGVQQIEIDNGSEGVKFVVRLPEKVRDKVRTELVFTLPGNESDKGASMNTWFLAALSTWVNLQRQQHALLSASIELQSVEHLPRHPQPDVAV